MVGQLCGAATQRDGAAAKVRAGQDALPFPRGGNKSQRVCSASFFHLAVDVTSNLPLCTHHEQVDDPATHLEAVRFAQTVLSQFYPAFPKGLRMSSCKLNSLSTRPWTDKGFLLHRNQHAHGDAALRRQPAELAVRRASLRRTNTVSGDMRSGALCVISYLYPASCVSLASSGASVECSLKRLVVFVAFPRSRCWRWRKLAFSLAIRNPTTADVLLILRYRATESTRE